MPTFIRMAVAPGAPAPLLGDHYRAIAPFIGIGLVVALIAASSGVQGVWL